MGGVTELLAQAREAGLAVRADGDRLIVEGPRRHAALVGELLARKADVLAALKAESRAFAPLRAHDVTDPRPEFESDSRLWTYLLKHSFIEHGERQDGAFAFLHVVRLAGGRLRWHGNRLRIEPDSTYEGNWATERELLVPHRVAIARWLKTIAEGEVDAGAVAAMREAA